MGEFGQGSPVTGMRCQVPVGGVMTLAGALIMPTNSTEWAILWAKPAKSVNPRKLRLMTETLFLQTCRQSLLSRSRAPGSKRAGDWTLLWFAGRADRRAQGRARRRSSAVHRRGEAALA